MKMNEIKYKIIKSNEIDICLREKEQYKKTTSKNDFKTYICAFDKEKIIGYACLEHNYDNENSKHIKESMTLSVIEVHDDYRKNGIATKIIELLINEIKKENKILIRTSPSAQGRAFVFNKISEMCNDEGVCYISHNLKFIYEYFIQNEEYQNIPNIDKKNIVESMAEKMLEHESLKEWFLDSIEDVNDSFYDAFKDLVQMDNKSKNKKRLISHR